ncbi:MAG TPA: YIP1 family protein [Pyrinomonadaceae bacterium]|nr:YIP1 family protein [Pyrinomonadaceae bacterium]
MSASNESFQPPPPPPSPETPSAPRPTHLRPFAIAFFVIGLIVVAAGIPKLGLIPGGIATGAALAFCGIVLFAFSFIRLPAVPESEEPLPFMSKITGIFFEPTRVFRNLRVHPNWVGAYAVVVVLSLIYSFAFVNRITPERIVDHMSQKMSEMGPPFAPPPDRIEAMREAQLNQLKNPLERVQTVVKSAVGVLILGAFTAALCMLGLLAFGGRINYWQALSVVFYYWLPITAIQKLLGLAILYLKAPEDLHPILNQETTLQDNLGILMSAADHPILFVMLSFIGLTWFYTIWLRAKGLHNAATRASSSAGWGVSILLYVLLLFFVTIWTSLFPGFIS